MSSNKNDSSATTDEVVNPRSFSPSTQAILDQIDELNRFCDGMHQVDVQPVATDSSTGSSEVSTSADPAPSIGTRQNIRQRFSYNAPVNMEYNLRRTSRTARRNDEVINISDLSGILSEEDDDVIFVPEVINLCTPNRNVPESTTLDTTRVGSSTTKQSQAMCPICITPVTDPVCTKCGHVFCEACINRAVDASKKCPLCNAKIFKKHFRRIFF